MNKTNQPVAPDCSTHRKDLYGLTDMKAIAESIGDLHYETLAELLLRLKEKLQDDSTKDKESGRELLAKKLWLAAGGVYTGYVNITIASAVCKQFMNDARTPPATVSQDELTIDDYKESFDDHKRLVRELDVIINGNNAAKQASLCDIVAQLSKEYKSGTVNKPGRSVTDILKLADSALAEAKKDANHICTQLNKDEVISYNTGFYGGFKLGYIASPQSQEIQRITELLKVQVKSNCECKVCTDLWEQFKTENNI